MNRVELICWTCTAAMLPGAPAAGEMRVTARTVAGDRVEGLLIGLDGELVIQPSDGGQQLSLPRADVVQIERQDTAGAPAAAPCLLLRNGDRLYGRISGSAVDQIVFDTVMRAAVSVPVERLHAYLGPASAQERWRPPLRQLLRSAADQDRLLLANGDLMSGFVVSVGPQEVLFEHRRREMRVGLDAVVALVIADEPLPGDQAATARLWFVDGSVLRVLRVRWTPEALDVTFFDGSLQNLSPATVRKVELIGPRWTWLGDLQPAAYRHTPMLSLHWDYLIDKNVGGGPLMVGGQRFEHGIGVHSKAVLTYDLNGAYQQFTALCGIDDSGGPLADVAASIVVDRQTRWQQRHITKANSPQQVRVDVRGARTLELHVDYGDNGDVQDRFDWLDAALVR